MRVCEASSIRRGYGVGTRARYATCLGCYEHHQHRFKEKLVLVFVYNNAPHGHNVSEQGISMKNHLFFKVFIAIICGILAGWYTGAEKQIFNIPFLDIYTLIGQLFLNALNLVVVPLVVASIITGAARIG